MKKSKLLALLLALGLVLTACGGSGGKQDQSDSAATEAGAEQASGDQVYKIAIDSKFAPFSIAGDDLSVESYTGIDVDIIKAIAEDQGFEIELMPMDFSGIIPALTSGGIDGGLGAMSITEERKASVDFSDPYYDSALAVVVNKETEDIASIEDLQGKTAAVKKGTTGSMFAEDNQENLGLKVDFYDDTPSMFMAVSNKQADFLMEDFPVIAYQIKTGEQANLKIAIENVAEEQPQYGFAVKKGENAELLEMFNKGLANIKENGTYEEILNKYK